jgi:abortive infection bacteriophage resistance protein
MNPEADAADQPQNKYSKNTNYTSKVQDLRDLKSLFVIMSDFTTKGLIAFLAIVALWNVTKLPYYLSFNNDGNTAYNDHGIELSINLGHWVKVCLLRNLSYIAHFLGQLLSPHVELTITHETGPTHYLTQ